MSTAQKLYEKAQTLPEAAQETLLRMAELLAANSHPAAAAPKLSFGSAKGLIEIGSGFDEPLEDFKPYTA